MTLRAAARGVASLSDSELLARVARGDYAALAPIYDRHHEDVARFVGHAIGGSHDAEDIVQETFLCAARKASTFDGGQSCRLWLFGIAVRQILHVRRAFARLRDMLERHRQLSVPLPSSDPCEDIETVQERWRLERAIGTLSEAKRIVLLMAEVEEMSCEQISVALGIPIGTVWTRLHHARRDLRDTLGEETLAMHTCSRHWEAEAVRDGRLSGAEARAFLEHTASCRVCSQQVLSLEELGASLRALPAPPRDALTARRTRRRLLQRLDEQHLRPERRWRTRLAWTGGLVAVVIALGLWRRSPPSQMPATVSQHLSVEIVPRGKAAWSERSHGSRHEVVVDSGEVLVKVTNKGRADSLVLRTPDAEIEDIGTIFSVRVVDGATREVHVVEGAVNIRRHGEAPLVVTAGDRWMAPDVVADVSASAVAPGSVPSPFLVPAPTLSSPSDSRSPTPVGTAPSARGRAGHGVMGPVSTASATSRLDDHALEFEQAMVLFRTGQLVAASARFEAFVLHYPRDPHAEDAAYLCVVALVRSGQQSAARQAATSYLARYPSGLRTREVEGLVR